MGRNKLVMKKIENSTSRQQTYSKRKDSIVKKANELAVLCDTDVALLMFSPTGQLTSYSSRGSVEDIMLRVVNRPGELHRRPIPNEQHFSQRLTQLKYESEMVEKIAMYVILLLHSIYSPGWCFPYVLDLLVHESGYMTSLFFFFSFSFFCLLFFYITF
ncbi:agamous-like MADS-box protein AGL104 [Nicotiana tabacum]|uniref:Agamous-like MADS-box protein AGL104 n=2 Tax=Nicotiana tabacum TaxID=4097 RepID=A0AC58S3D0_TOBAC